MKPRIIYGSIVGAILIASIAWVITTNPGNALAQTSMQNTTSSNGSSAASTNTAASDNTNITKVKVGGGNSTVQYYRFAPQRVEINAGQSVRWYSPAEGMSELHTVTFVLNKTLNSDVILPFVLSDNNTTFKLVPPANVGEPVIMPTPNGTKAILAANKLTFSPAIITQNSSSPTYLNGTSIHVTLNGTEQGVNSGIFQPKSFLETMNASAQNDTGSATASTQQNMTTGTNSTTTSSANTSQNQQSTSTASEQGGPPIPFVKQFTVTFEKPGTYDYFCAFHPWMTGEVVVK